MFGIIYKITKELRFFKNYKFGSLWNYIHGFTVETASVCRINKSNYKDFLCNRDYKNGHPWNGAYTGIIDNKLFLPMLFMNYPEYIPTYFYYKDADGFLNMQNGKREDYPDFLQLLHSEKRLCLKHTHSSVGKGFMLVCFDGNDYTINNETVTSEQLKDTVLQLEQYIVTQYVHQHQYSKDICSTSVNSIRMIVAWDSQKKEFFLARCFHRFGCNGNVVDNIGSGNGLLVFVDPETGILTNYGAINKNKSGHRSQENIVHPDKQIPLTGMQIPNFNEIKSKILEIANSMSYLRWVGFDVVITPDGFKILETNSLSSLLDQGKSGYLKDPRLRRLFRK